jgi:hypothetical protein
MKDIEKVFRIFIISIWIFFISTVLYITYWGVRGYSYPLILALIFILIGIVISYLITNRD